MPAPRPSKATMGNAIQAICAAGLIPGAIQINSDGSFRVEILKAGEPTKTAGWTGNNDMKAPTWEEAA